MNQVIHDWELVEIPTVDQCLQFTILARLQWEEDAPAPNKRLYARVYEVLEERQEYYGLIMVMNFTDVIAEIRTECDADFVEAHDDKLHWGFKTGIIGGADTLEKLDEMLKSVSSPTVNYRIFTNGQRARIVCIPVIEPETLPASQKPKDARWNKCHITGQPHHFIDPPYPLPFTFHGAKGCDFARICKDCHGLFLNYDE